MDPHPDRFLSDEVREAAREQLESELRVRAAWLYYMEDLTQEAIAERLGTTRARVLKMLAQSRKDGTVQIRVTGRLSHCVELERRLEARFGISEVIVIPTPDNEAMTSQLIGMRVGALLDSRLKDGMTVSVGWGETLRSSLHAMVGRPLRDFTVVSMLGGMTRASGHNPSELVWRFADLYGGQCYMMAAPVLAPDEATRQALFGHEGLAEVMDRARRADLAVVSVGDFSASSTIARYGLLNAEDLDSLIAAGAVCDVLCHFLDREGNLVDHPVNRRVMALNPRELSTIPGLILASGGRRKVEGILATLKFLKPSSFVTDEATADALLARV